VLANEQVVNGKCWRHDGPDDPPAVKKSIKQWFFKITDYADALLAEIPALDWPEKIKTAQTNWIGKSQGAEIVFKIASSRPLPSSQIPAESAHSSLDSGPVIESAPSSEKSEILSEAGAAPLDATRAGAITVFTTRPDTIFGATFLVLAPEHPLAKQLASDEQRKAVENYVEAAVKKTEIDRLNDTKEKTGVFTGSYAVNPATGENIPIWVADYVLYGYGTGAIMAVPAHDERDNAFARKFSLPIVNVVDPVAVRADAKDKKTDVRKNKIVAVVTNDKNELLTINWGDKGGRLFVGGTVEGDEESSVTALREVTEETGYNDLEIQEVGNETFHYKYYAFSKEETHETDVTFLKLRLKSESRQGQNLDESEKNNFTVEWVSQDIAVKEIVEPLHRYGFDKFIEGKVFHGEGVMTHSGDFDGLDASEAREKVVAWLEQEGTAREKTTYKMRDWLISRQRYWGAPIPIIHCEEHGAVAVPEDQLPVLLPEVDDFAPKGDGKSALARVEDWVNTTCPTCGKPAKRETDTMDGYACSSWYLLRYTDPHDNAQAWKPELANYWSPVDFYVGGDHAVAHLLYVRFWAHVFHDMGLIDFKEPVKKLVYHGLIAAEDGRKMSKSLGNTVDPLEIIDQGYGADALRTFELFLGPIDENSNWSSTGIAGVYRFINRVWTLVQEFDASDKSFTGNDTAVTRLQHKTTRRVTGDIRRLSFNTAISGLMEYVNDLYKLKVDGFSDAAWRDALSTLTQLIAPFAPHVAEELWQQLGHEGLVQDTMWPAWDDALIVSDTVTIIVQVNGKLRAKLEVAKDLGKDDIEQLALANEHVQTFVDGKEPNKIIYVPGKLVNIVV